MSDRVIGLVAAVLALLVGIAAGQVLVNLWLWSEAEIERRASSEDVCRAFYRVCSGPTPERHLPTCEHWTERWMGDCSAPRCRTLHEGVIDVERCLVPVE